MQGTPTLRSDRAQVTHLTPSGSQVTNRFRFNRPPTGRRLMQMVVAMACIFCSSFAIAQINGNGTISGVVSDPKGAVIVGAEVSVVNTATGVTQSTKSNATGFYEVIGLVPGPYKVTSEVKGFKALVRDGLTLHAGSSLDVQLKLAIGSQTETVTVIAEAPLVNNSPGSDGQVVTTSMIQNVPSPGENPLLMLRMNRDVQTNNQSNQYLKGSYNAASANSGIGTQGQVSKNEFSLDGAVNQINAHQVAYAPPTDEVQEMVTDTSGFDAQQGKTLGLSVEVSTKGGTNAYHGTVSNVYEDDRWQSFTHNGRYNYINAVNALSTTACQGAGAATCALNVTKNSKPGTHENNSSASVGGPVDIPRLFNGKNKLFFFVSVLHDKFTTVTPTAVTVPTQQERGLNGGPADFSDLFSQCATATPAGCPQNVIYDPLTVSSVTANARQPFGGCPTVPGSTNCIPASRIASGIPAALLNFYNKELPLPNFVPTNGPTGTGNYAYNIMQPNLFTSYTERMDYTPRETDRIFIRSTKTHYLQETEDYTTDNLRQQVVNQDDWILAADWSHSFSPNSILDSTVSYTRFETVQGYPNEYKFPASAIGLPSYIDALGTANGENELPIIAINGYNNVSSNSGPSAYYKTIAGRSNFTYVHSAHSIKAGAEYRIQNNIAVGGSNYSGSISFDNTYTRQFVNGSGGPSQLGLSYAAFMLGIQTNSTTSSAVRYDRANPYYALYLEDNWRLTPKLSLNVGMRYEYEYGPTESNNGQLSYFDPSQVLPIASGVATGYAANLTAYKAAIPAGDPAPPTSLSVNGGPVYSGVNGASRRAWTNNQRFLPRIAFAYGLTPKQVLRGGYGLFYDTLNVLNITPDQTGYSATTSDNSSLTGNVGSNGDWVSGNPYAGVAPITNPFPVNSVTAARFVQPVGNSLGNMATVGGGFTYNPAQFVPARQQRWQVTYEKQVGSSMAIIADYTGSFTDRLQVTHNYSYMPAGYFTGGNVLNPNTNALNANVANPFNISNFASLQTSNPVVYNNAIAARSFFTSPTIALNTLLKAYPQYSGTLQENASIGQAKFEEGSLSFRRNMKKGLEFTVNYQRIFSYDRDYFANSFDEAPSWEDSNNSRPSRITVTASYSLPFGKGRSWATEGWKSAIFGGFQIDGSYIAQQGPLIGFGNLIYYGSNPSNIKKHGVNYGQWFNTQDFDWVGNDPGASAKQLGAYNLRVFPTRIDGVRQQGENNFNANLQRTFNVTEKVHFMARFQCFDLFNHTIIAGPNTSATSTTFGSAVGVNDTASFARFIEVQGKISF